MTEKQTLTKRIGFRLSDDLYQFHLAEAKKQERSMSNYFEKILKDLHLQKQKQSEFFFGE